MRRTGSSTVGSSARRAGKAGSGQANSATVNDYTELVLKLRVPSNANSFSFNSQFLSAEYPQFVCTSFNVAVVVLLAGASTPDDPPGSKLHLPPVFSTGEDEDKDKNKDDD